MLKLSVAHEFLPKTPTLRTAAVMDHFGIDFEAGRHVVANGLDLDLRPGSVCLFTGPSGSGKSSLMRAAAAELAAASCVVDMDELKLPDRPLVDALPGTVEDAMRLLSRCGLAEAHLMLRAPAELSEGQRYRFRLAMALAACSPGSETPDHAAWIVADEFTATLDRTLARVIAAGVKKWGVGVLLATTHEDVVADLQPDVWVRCELGEEPRVVGQASPAGGDSEAFGTSHTSAAGSARPTVKKNSPGSSGSARAPRPTGRTSLGGITGRTRSDCCDS